MEKYLILKGGQVALEGAPEQIRVLPLGHVVSSKGAFDVDEESYAAMCSGIAERGVDLVVDYEHQTLNGTEAPAAGWVKALKMEDGAILATVEWTPKAANYLRNREYRYLSPVVNVRRSDNKAVGLHSLALTNTPAIRGMNPIVNSEHFEGGANNMELIKRIAQLLGLGDDATDDQIEEAIEQLLENRSGAGTGEDVVANKAVCELLDLKAGAPASDVAAKIMALKSGVIGGVNVVEELKQLKEANAQKDADAAVQMALKSGKITPAQQEWAKSYALSDPIGFGSFVEKAPQVVPMGEIQLAEKKALKNTELDEATLIACKQLGLAPDEVKEYL